MYKLCFYVPEDQLEVVKSALFAVGAGRIGNYEHCAWQALGKGQFKPQAGSKPFIGELGVIEVVEEWKVEMVCADEIIKDAVAALKVAHPYEEPAYDVWKLEDI